MISELKFDTGSRKVAGLQSCSESDQTLLCLHGYLDNACSFEPLFPYLKQFNTIAIDLAGHGKSEHRNSANTYHLTDYAFDILDFLEAYLAKRDESKVFILGHSLGGIIGSIFCACYPNMVNAFISIEACGPLAQEPTTTVQQLRKSFQSRIRLKYSHANQTRNLPQLIDAKIKVSDIKRDDAERIILRNLNNENFQWTSDRALRTVSAMRMTEAQSCNILSAINVPMSLYLGRHGFEKVKTDLQKRIEHIPSLRDVREFEGGHYVHLQNPQTFAQAATKFFLDYEQYKNL